MDKSNEILKVMSKEDYLDAIFVIANNINGMICDIINNKLYPQLCCIAYWLRSINMQSTFTTDVKNLLQKYPLVDTIAMGFPMEWEQEPLWQE